VRYRSVGERQWHQGLTASISASGAVIEGDAPASRSSLVCAISLPACDGCLTGRARVVRRQRHGDTFVIAVRRFRIERRASAFSRRNPAI